MISPQSIRKGIIIKFDGIEVDKATVIKASEEWKENHEILFKKLLKQGGSFKINGVLVEVKPTDKMLTSRGEQDGGVIQVDAFARF
jgi:translation elongation factor P/translation initiation factor 5A